jgi:anaerobic magnesium-protoporphyrin IX monomethyl ester cyclase
MAKNTVVFVGFRDQDNLGIGYLSAVLLEHGFQVEFVDFREGPPAILERVRQLDPLVIGLSVIFQYYATWFANLVGYLRQHGVSTVICAGGHYPSLRYDEFLEAMPELDAVVRFEGEYTLLEMAQRLAAGQDWRDLPSIAYREDGRVVANPLRPLIEDLDALPVPYRYHYPDACLGVPVASILASRGCPRGCSFCSIRQFYAAPPGKLRRVRSPANVAAEMRQLYDERGTRVFLFQDDDFAMTSARDRAWVGQFVKSLERQDLLGQVLWRISCRADEVEPELFGRLKDAGLSMVYLGLESGNETGLKVLNKHINLEQNRRAARTLARLEFSYDYGFMLFDPSSTFERVLDNVRFLRDICGDGSAPIPFGKMVPYAATDIEEQLRQEGRLHGDVRHPDYDFLDPRLGPWFLWLQNLMALWAIEPDSLLAHLRMTRFEVEVLDHFYRDSPGRSEYRATVTGLAAAYNEAFCRMVEESAPLFARDGASEPDDELWAAREELAAGAAEWRRRLSWELEDRRHDYLQGIAGPGADGHPT